MHFETTSLPTKIFETLRDRIIYLEYPPQMALLERDLCKEFQVSRTPLREAIQKLRDMKLVTVIPRYGTFVSPIDINEIRCAFEVKTKLESLAGEVAAKRITTDRLRELHALIQKADKLSSGEHRTFIEIDARFHEIVYTAAQNPILQEMLENLHSRCARLWTSSLTRIIEIPETINQLREIYDALEKADPAKVAELMERHVQYFVNKIKSQLL